MRPKIAPTGPAIRGTPDTGTEEATVRLHRNAPAHRFLIYAAAVLSVGLPLRAAQSQARPNFPPGIDAATTAQMPLDLRLAKKLPLPEPLAAVRKVIGALGEGYTLQGAGQPGDVWYRWYHDCGNAMSFGDAIARDGQVMSIWFEGCADENCVA